MGQGLSIGVQSLYKADIAPGDPDDAGPAGELRPVEAGDQVPRNALASAARGRRPVRDLDVKSLMAYLCFAFQQTPCAQPRTNHVRCYGQPWSK